MKHWDHLTTEERAERLGDPDWDRNVNREANEAALIERYRAGLPLSTGDRQRARRLLRRS